MNSGLHEARAEARTVAARELSNLVVPFETSDTNVSGIVCPWLEWWLACGCGHVELLEGILMLQDWDRIPMVPGATAPNRTLDDAITHVAKVVAGDFADADPTTRRLLARRDWHRAIKSGRWIVMNAVWGLPKRDDKCGYLGAKLHKAAFEAWRVVVECAAAIVGSRFKLVTAGSWSRFDGDDPDTLLTLSEYTAKWANWAKRSSKRVDGTHFDVAHPSTWPPERGHDWTKGPL